MQTHTPEGPRLHQGVTASLLRPLRGVMFFYFLFFGLINHLVVSLRRKIAEGEKTLVMKCFSICILESLNSRLPSLFVLRQETSAALTMSIQPPPYRSLINLTATNKHHQYAFQGGILWLLLSKAFWWLVHHCHYADYSVTVNATQEPFFFQLKYHCFINLTENTRALSSCGLSDIDASKTNCLKHLKWPVFRKHLKFKPLFLAVCYRHIWVTR